MSIAARPASAEDRKGKIGGVIDRSAMIRVQDGMRSIEEVDFRQVDIPMHHLAKKYPDELQKAEEAIETRRASWKETLRMKFFYDYDNDKRYQHWVEEKKAAKEHLHEHWIDGDLDDFDRMWRKGVRLFSSFGIFLGVYRTMYLWKKMDKNYLKLHGIGLASIATYELPMAILKGCSLGVVAAGGCQIGDLLARIYICWRDDDVTRPRRCKTNVFFAGTAAGLWTGPLLGWYCHMAGFTRKISIAVSFATLAAFGAFSFYLGQYVYDPWVKMYPQSYDDPHHVPWFMRRMRYDGDHAVRGRYV